MDGFPILEAMNYDDIRPSLRSGDVLLASGEYMFSRLIQHATDSCWSHVAFIMRLDVIDRVMVLESIEGKGVRTIPLSEYVRNFEGTGRGYKGRLAVSRHRNFEAVASEEGLKRMAQFAVDRFARPYDEEEIARITARIVASKLGFKNSEIKRNDEYICSEYVFECYNEIGLEIAYDKRGFVAPADFFRDGNMQALWEVAVQK